MAKKIRFPLIMDRDAEARNLEELRENFSLRAVLEYYENGKLLTWLENLYLLDEADQIRGLDKEAPDFQRRLCGIFQVEYTRDMDPKVIEQRKKRLERLRAVMDEDEHYRNIDYVAFDQEELADLLDEGATAICLCREEGKDFTFTIPASCKGVTYTGVITHSGQKPRVRISGGTLEDMGKLGITEESFDVEKPMPQKRKIVEETNQMLTDSNISRIKEVLPDGGIVVTTGENGLESWKNIVSIACGFNHTVGLKKDGTVMATDRYRYDSNKFGQCNVESWKNIVSIACGNNHTVGLKKDGTVVAIGDNSDTQCDVETWRDIISIVCGYSHTVGLKKDGTVVATGNNNCGQCDVAIWRDIVSITCKDVHTIGLKKDGTVVATGNNDKNQCDVESWKNIVSIASGGWHTVGLQNDGTVIATGFNNCGQCNLGSWRDIVSVACGPYHTVGLKKNGTVETAGFIGAKYSVEAWKDIVSIACGDNYTTGLKKNGTIVASEYYQHKDIVETWRDIVFIACVGYYTVAIQKPR